MNQKKKKKRNNYIILMIYFFLPIYDFTRSAILKITIEMN